MEHLEKVEKLKQHADVSYEEAKKALEACGWDILDALVLLESQGKTAGPGTDNSTLSDKGPSEDGEAFQEACQPLTICGESQKKSHQRDERQQPSFFAKLGKAIKYLVQKGVENSLVIKQHGQPLLDLPVIAFIILLICAFWAVVPVMVISLFFDFSYNFKGAELGKDKINRTMDQATEAVNNFKSEINKD
ncbi:DUF4342 domain-containing protein [bacterium 210820-DFI.6.37]|nr:DUF4342 domain-containing protein [bacterium 210820-DFI.6.37]